MSLKSDRGFYAKAAVFPVHSCIGSARSAINGTVFDEFVAAMVIDIFHQSLNGNVIQLKLKF